MVLRSPRSTLTDTLFPYTTRFRSPLLSENVKIGSPIARNSGVPVITFSNDVSVAGGGTYVLGYSPAQSIDRVVDYAHQRGVTQYAGLIPLGLYGQRASTAFLRAVEDAGGEVVSLRSEEHTSELQSLMRISYAVFCLKKKK